MLEKLEKKVWEQRLQVGLGREQGAGGKGAEEKVRALYRTFQLCLCPLGWHLEVGGWALDLHTHSIPNCGWDVRRNAEGLAGAASSSSIKDKLGFGRHLSYLLPHGLESPV